MTTGGCELYPPVFGDSRNRVLLTVTTVVESTKWCVFHVQHRALFTNGGGMVTTSDVICSNRAVAIYTHRVKRNLPPGMNMD